MRHGGVRIIYPQMGCVLRHNIKEGASGIPLGSKSPRPDINPIFEQI